MAAVGGPPDRGSCSAQQGGGYAPRQPAKAPLRKGDGGKRVPSGDGGKCVPSGHLREAQNDPQSSTETSVGYGSSLHED